jgi:Fe-S-cluster-containing dehydrogenase component
VIGTDGVDERGPEEALMFGYEFYVDPSRCIGCQSCVKACEECETHRGRSMINFDFIDRPETIASAAYVCFHCDDPTCAQVCPADAIKKGVDGIVQSALEPRCISCGNCVLACPFGIPKIQVPQEQMMKCDMCYDRTSAGKKPMCATVCPSQALTYATAEEIARTRREHPTNEFWFGAQRVTTKVFMMVPLETEAVTVDVADYIWEAR